MGRALGGALATLILAVLQLVQGTPHSRSGALQSPVRYVMRVRELKTCDHEANLLVLGKPQFQMQRDGSDVVNVNFTIRKNVEKINEIKIVVHRCVDGVTSNTCEYFGRYTWRVGVCQVYSTPGAAWAPITHRIHPNLANCPFKEGNYTATNATWDMKHPFILKVMGGFYWLGELTFKDQDDVEAVCLRGVVHFPATGRRE